jgi:hypothetical protein
MQSHARSSLLQHIPSKRTILLLAGSCAFSVLVATLALQWLVYDDWLHMHGPLRLVGSALASILTFVFALHLLSAARQRRLEILHHFETIAWANDRIRNALQTIECATYFANPEAMTPVLESANVIENVLHEVLAKTHPAFHTTGAGHNAGAGAGRAS